MRKKNTHLCYFDLINLVTQNRKREFHSFVCVYLMLEIHNYEFLLAAKCAIFVT